MINFYRAAALCIGAFLYAFPAVGADRTTPLTAVGGRDDIWLYRWVPKGDGESGGVVLTYGQSLSTGLRFRVFQGDAFGGFIASSALRGNNLHIFYRDGSQYRLRYVRHGLSTPPRDDDFREITAPGGIAPTAVCGDTDANTVFAIVSTKFAASLPLHIQPVEASPPSEDSDGQDTNDQDSASEQLPITAATLLSETASPPKFSLVQYFRGNWEFVSLCPKSLDAASKIWLATHRGTYALLHESKGDSKELMLLIGSKDGWDSTTPVPNLSAKDVLGFFSQGDVFTLVAREQVETSTTASIKAHRLLDGVWKTGSPMELENEPLLTFDGQVAASYFQSDLVLAYEKESEGKTGVWVGVWPIAGGLPIAAPTEVAALAQDRASSATTQTAAIIIAVLLTLLLFVVFARRTPSLFIELDPPEGYVLAGAGKRLFAFLIDVFVVSLIAFPLFITPWLTKNFDPGDNIQREIAYLLEYDPTATFVPWIQCLVLLVVYATAAEIAFKATPGKLILGLRVCTTQGKDCSILATIIRNVLRFELYYNLMFLPLAMLILLTRNHQRLGDLVANTLVIEKKPVAKKS